MKYSIKKQKVSERTGRTSLSNMATLHTQQLYPYSLVNYISVGSTLECILILFV